MPGYSMNMDTMLLVLDPDWIAARGRIYLCSPMPLHIVLIFVSL